MKRIRTIDAGRACDLRYLLGLVAAAVSLTSPASSDAQVRCGDVIPAGANVVLQSNLECDDVDVAITVVGPAVLDLNGFAVSCADRNANRDEVITGILLEGRGAVVRDGAVRRCRQSVGLRGEGKHTVSNVTTAFASSDGVRAESDGNTIVDSSAFFCDGAGFDIEGKANVLSGNVATGNRNGFDVGDRNRLRENTAASSDFAGFVVRSRRSVLKGNRAVGNAVGYRVPGIANRLEGNEAENNHTGILLETISRRNVVEANVVADTELHGIVAGGVANRIVQNSVDDSGGNGIRTTSVAERTIVRGNVARRNASGDLSDDAPACGTNRWRNNEFTTSNQSCIE